MSKHHWFVVVAACGLSIGGTWLALRRPDTEVVVKPATAAEGGNTPSARSDGPQSAKRSPVPMGDETVAVAAAGPAEVARRVCRSLVRIHARGVAAIKQLPRVSDESDTQPRHVDLTCIGFVIDDKGHVATRATIIHPAGVAWKEGPTYAVEFGPGAERVDNLPPNAKAESPCEIVGVDDNTDLAVLKIPAGLLPPLKLADPRELAPGAALLAVEFRAHLDRPAGFARGTIQAVDETTRHGLQSGLLRTDVTIDPSRQGVPLVSLRGEVVGINAWVERGAIYALSCRRAAVLLPKLIADGRIVRGSTGISMREVGPEVMLRLNIPTGLIVATAPPAADAPLSLVADDIITRINDYEINCMGDYVMAMAMFRPGDRVRIEVRRYPRSWLREKLGIKPANAEEEAQRRRDLLQLPPSGEHSEGFARTLSFEFALREPGTVVPVGPN